MISNPEFRRNLWLEMSAHRLIGIPLMLSILLLLAYLTNGSELNQGVADGAQFIAVILTMLWGANMASEAVLSEVREHTWDSQRMSAMPAWSLMWGKLLGSTMYTWYGTLFCMLVYVFASELTPLITIKHIMLIIFAGLLAQALAMLLALRFIRKGDKIVRSPSILFVLFAASTAWGFFSVAMHSTATLKWYDLSFDPINFGLSSMLAFLAWTWLANYRLMRAELQINNYIWVWLSFVVFLMVYIAGIFTDVPWKAYTSLSMPLLVAFIVAAVATYLMLFSESKDPVHYKRLLVLLTQKNWHALQSSLQCWMGALVLAVLSGLILSAQMVSEDINPMFIIALLLFISRDICLVLYLNFNVNRKRADMTAMFYLFVLYVVLPGIFASMDMSTALFLPYDEHGSGWVSAGAALAECAFAFWLMWSRWLRNYGSC